MIILDSISLIIPIYNEEKHLMRLLKSLDLQKIKKVKIEVLLINGMSNDKSEKIILDFIKNQKVLKYNTNIF